MIPVTHQLNVHQDILPHKNMDAHDKSEHSHAFE
jgi:hypothetical protein